MNQHLVILIITAIAITLIFAWKWLWRKSFKNPYKKEWVIVLATIVTIIMGYTCFFSFLFYADANVITKEFNEAEWKVNPNERYKMAENIVERKLLNGKDSLYVANLLGKPAGANSDFARYEMGTTLSGFSTVFHSLNIKFDKKKVVSVDHHQTFD